MTRRDTDRGSNAMPSPRNVDQLDGTLLRVLCALVEEKSVTLAARRLGQTQPAVSGSLKRLREVFGDPLLVREKLAMVPTARGLQLAEKARGVLAALGDLAEPDAFDPAEAAIPFRVASPDYLAPSFLAEVARRMVVEAPRCRLVLHPLGADFDSERALADDKLDVIVGNWPSPPERLRLLLLLEDDVVCMVRHDHPLAGGPLTVAQYLEAGHVVPLPYSSVQRGVVETHLAELGVQRDARVVVPYFGLAPHIVAATDLVFTTARHFAQSFATALPIAILEAPVGFPAMRFYQLWHDRTHHVASHRWLRGLIADVARRHFVAADAT